MPVLPPPASVRSAAVLSAAVLCVLAALGVHVPPAAAASPDAAAPAAPAFPAAQPFPAAHALPAARSGAPDGPVAPAGGGPGGARYAPPVDAAVSDPFRPPAGPYGPGNRGLQYATVGGEPVRAVGPGVVAVAGPVAGRLVVSVVHPDGLRSMLTGLASVAVGVGDRVASGTAVGRAGPGLHLGVRRGRTYLDPAALFGRRVRPLRAVLVPLPPGSTRPPRVASGPGRWWAQPAGR